MSDNSNDEPAFDLDGNPVYDISPEQANAEIASQFPEHVIRDGRRKYALPVGVVPGTPSYWKWYREKFKDRYKMYQKKAYLKRKLTAAAIDVSVKEGIPYDEAMQHVEAQLAAIKLTEDYEKRAAKGKPIHDGVEEENYERIPFIAELADEQGVSYEEAEQIMNAEDYKYPDSFTLFKLRKGGDPSL